MSDNIYVSPIFELARNILKEGWLYGNSLNSYNPNREPDMRDGVGIYRKAEAIEKSLFFGLIKYKVYPNDPKIGMIWINNQSRGAYESSIWKLEVFGEQHIKPLINFTERVCPNGVDFKSSLESHNEYTYHPTDY